MLKWDFFFPAFKKIGTGSFMVPWQRCSVFLVWLQPITIKKNILWINSVHDHFLDPKCGFLEQTRWEGGEKKIRTNSLSHLSFLSTSSISEGLSCNLCWVMWTLYLNKKLTVCKQVHHQVAPPTGLSLQHRMRKRVGTELLWWSG